MVQWWNPIIESEWEIPAMFIQPEKNELWSEIHYWYHEFMNLFDHDKVYKTTAIQTLHLKAKHVAVLEPWGESVINRYGNAATIYPIGILAELGILMYGTREDFEEVKRKRPRRDRRVKLEMALKKHGLVLREDSTLCEQYIRSGSPAIKRVVTVMMEMKFFFEHTDYETIRDEMYEEEREERDRLYEEDRYERDEFDHYHEFDHYRCDAQEISSWAKERALAQFILENPKNGNLISLSLRKPKRPRAFRFLHEALEPTR